MNTEKTIKTDLWFLSGGGEMGQLIREKDWSKTSLGAPESWPQSLRTMVSVMLGNPFGMYIAWGNDYTQLYNDGYRPILGATKHPQALGISTRETFSEIWHIIESMFDGVMKGKAVGVTDFMYRLNRYGYDEECYFDFSYSPIRKDNGEVGGVLVIATETTAKKRVTDALKESNTRYINNIMQAPVAMCILRGENHVVEIANEQMMEIWGKQAEQVMNKPIFEGLPEAKDQGLEPLLDNVFKTGEKSVANERPVNLPRNGKVETTYLNFVYEALKETDGTISGIAAIATEVTQQVISRSKVEESEQKVRALVENAPFPIAVYTGKEMIVELANQSIIDIWGKGNDVIGKSFKEVLPELDNQLVFEQIASVLKNGESFHTKNTPLELVVDGKSQTFYFNYSLTPLHDISGNVYGVMNTGVDLTDLNIAKKQIEQSERLYKAITQNTPDLIYVFDLNYRFTYANEALLQMWGLKWGDAIGKDMLEIGYEPWHAEMHIKEINQIIASKKTIRGEVSFPHATLGKRIYDYIFAPVIDGDGNVVAITGTTRDVTQLVEARKQIEESDKRFRTTVKQAPVGITILRGPKYVVEMANDTYLQLVDRTEDKFVGQPLFDSLPEVKESVNSLLDSVLNTGVPYHGNEVEIPVNRYGKQEIGYFDFLYYPLKEEDGQISGVIVTVTEVSEKVEARKKVEDSEKRYNLMLMQSPFAFLILKGKNLVVHLANESMKEVLGKGSDIEGKPLLEVLPEIKGQAFPDLLNNVYNTGIPFSANEMLAKLTRNGILEDVYFNYVYQPYYEADNTISGVTVIAYDVTSSVIANKKIEEAEETARLAINSAELGVYEIIYSTDEMITDSRFKEIWGVDKSVTRNEYADVIHPDDILQRKQAHEKSIKSGHLDYRARVIWKDESIHWVRITGKVIYDSKANPVKLIGIIQDITDAVNAREKIEESKEKLSIVIDASELGTYELNLLTDEVIYSDKYLEIFGFGKGVAPTHKELINRLHPSEMHMRNQAFKDSLVSGTLFYQAKVVWNDKSIHWVDVKGKVFYNEEKKPVKLIGTVGDITEEKRHEQELDKLVKERTLELEISSERFSKIFDENPVAMTLSEIGTNKILFANNLFYKYFGYTKEEVIGHSSQELKLTSPEEDARLLPILLAYLNETRSAAELQALPPEESEKLVMKLKAAMGNMNLEVLYTRKNGETFYAILSYDLIKIDNKTFTITSYQDISEKKKAENEIIAYSTELERKNKEIEQFAYVSSHDLQEPLRSISNFSTLLTQRLEAHPDKQAREYVAYINGGVNRMSTLIFDLLEYSRIGKDTIKLQIDCNKMVNDVLTSMSVSVKECEAEIHVTKLPVLSGFIYLESVFQNLISNAIKFRKAGTHPIITISATDKGKEFLFEVKDNGIGIEKEYYERIFIIFQRLHTRREYEGTGIGLSQCKKIIELHGGQIWLESNLGKGSIFKFTIPKI